MGTVWEQYGKGGQGMGGKGGGKDWDIREDATIVGRLATRNTSARNQGGYKRWKRKLKKSKLEVCGLWGK